MHGSTDLNQSIFMVFGSFQQSEPLMKTGVVQVSHNESTYF